MEFKPSQNLTFEIETYYSSSMCTCLALDENLLFRYNENIMLVIIKYGERPHTRWK